MKITKAKLKQIIREELENLEEYSPYKTGARPDKPHKKPGSKDLPERPHKQPGSKDLPGVPRTQKEEQEELEESEEEVINEELTRQDKTDVKKMVQDELGKLLKKKDTKDQMGEIVKKIMKKLYKDLSLEHPYIIDRIKV